MLEEIFIKILDNSATEAEKISFYQWIEEDSAQREIFYTYKNLYAVSNCVATKHVELQKDSFEYFWNKVNPVKEFGIYKFWIRYAAVFVVALVMGFMMRSIIIPEHTKIQTIAQKIEYTSEKGSVSTIHLEDGSAIWLSSASKIILSKNADGEMAAQLNGEAYFDLVPDTARKLIVDLGYFKLKDIGN